MRAASLAVVLCSIALGAAAPPAHGYIVEELGGPQSASNGMVIGPDGNFWVAEEFSATVARIALDGTVLGRFNVGQQPTSVANGPGDRVWIAVTGARKLVWIDAKAASPTTHDVPLGNIECPPVGLAAGGDGRMYMSLPSDGECGSSRIGSVSDTGMGPVMAVPAGQAYDIDVAGGKLWVPDFGGGVVQRLSLGSMAVEATIEMPLPGAAPDGITSDGAGTMWVTDWTNGTIASFPMSQHSGGAVNCAVGGGLANPFGIVVGADRRIYVAGKSSASVVRVAPDCTGPQVYSVPDSEPFTIINGVDNDLWFTDQKKTRLLHLVNDRPRLGDTGSRATGPTSAAAKAVVNPRGNATEVVFDFGRTQKYGKTTAPLRVSNGLDPSDVVGVLTKLASDTRYHVRARALNAEGEIAGPDMTFKTVPFPELSASTSIKVVAKGGTNKIVVDSIEITRLRGTETATITCKGRGCPFKRKAFRLKQKAKTFGASLFRGQQFGPGTAISVKVTAPRTIGTSTVLRISKKAGPNIVRACVKPGDKRASRCP